MSLETGAQKFPTITITLTGTGTSWADAADVLTPTTSFGAAYSQGFVAAEGATGDQFAAYAPAPLIGHGLSGILAVAGVLFGAGLLERSRRRRSPGTAISPAAA